MTLLSLNEASFAIGDQPILRNAELTLVDGERVCLIGRNGAGKSTLFGILTGEHTLDSGAVHRRQHLRMTQLEQQLPEAPDMQVAAYVAQGLVHLQDLLDEYRVLSEGEPDAARIREMGELQKRIEAEGGWDLERRVQTVLTELDLPATARLGDLSGGWKRRVALAKALVPNPELLLLDEPTNHLDLATIQWLEDKLRAWPGCVLFITHDRAFLQRLATRIVELDRTRLSSWPGDYQNFLLRKEEALEAEAKADALFDKKLAEEEVWVRQGVKARRTRNEGRVRALKELREQYAARLKPQAKARMKVTAAESSGRKVVELEHVTHGYGGEALIRDLTLTVQRGDRIGLVGNNGVGKSTLLKIMLGEVVPQKGKVKLGTNLEIGYFDQLRRELDPDKSVAETVGDGRDYVRMGSKSVHVIGYLRGFLFSPKRAQTKVGALSGGECNRLILARLFTRPSNLLILDEPTNDLDVETLEVLEEQLCEYPGTLIVVSHDREFLDNVVTSTLVFEEGGVVPYAGGYRDWLTHGKRLIERERPIKEDRRIEAAVRNADAPKKLSYKYQRELDDMPRLIAELEARCAALDAECAAADFYSQPFDQIQPRLDAQTAARAALDAALARWVELEAMRG
jgi:ATP-binding cassette subfamily F protein uup